MSLPKRRIYTDQPFSFSLTKEGSPVNWNSVTIQRLYMVSNDQGGAYAGELAHSVDTSDPSILHAEWDAHSQLYIGEHSVVCKMSMNGVEGSFDAPVVELVPHSSEIDTSEETTTVTVEIISGESEAIEVAVAIIGRGEGGGTGDHAELENLGFENSGHTGFQAEIEDLETIRSGAAAGATAVQTVNSQEPDEDGNVDVPVELVAVASTMDTSEGYAYPTLTVDQVHSVCQAVRDNRSVVVVAATNKRKRFFVLGENNLGVYDTCVLLSDNGQYIIKYVVRVPISTGVPTVFVEFSDNVPASVTAAIAAKLDSPSVAGQAGQVLTYQATGSPEWQNPAAPTGVVKYDGAQLLTASQKERARLNIGTYAKPTDGIPSTDLASGVQTTLGKVATIEGKIPSQASSENQLADKDFVNSSIQNVVAYYITKNAAGEPFATKAELLAATIFYSGGQIRVPTRNDYLVVLADESKTITETGENPTTRYIYDNNVWSYQYIVNRSGLTASQWAAVNSGITTEKVALIDSAYQKPSSGIPATDLEEGVIPDVSEFVTGEEMTEALAGKLDAPTDEGTEGQVLTLDENGNPIWTDPQGGGEGTVKSVNGIQPDDDGNVILDRIATSMPSTGFVPNIEYDLGVLSGATAFLLGTPADLTVSNVYFWTFDTGSTAPTVTWPSGLSWQGNCIDSTSKAPAVAASKHYEVTVRKRYAYCTEFDLISA